MWPVTVGRPPRVHPGSVPSPLPSRRAVRPHWFASVMGTGIVALALVGLPGHVPGARALAGAFWVLAAAMLLALLLGVGLDVRRRRGGFGSHLADPAVAPYLGAPAMAVLIVGGGVLPLADGVLGAAALPVAGVLWAVGTALGLASAVAVPVAAITRHDLTPDATSAVWLMPVVPPMTSAATGALLVPHVPAGEARATALVACYTLFGMTLVVSLLVVAMLWQRLLLHGPGPAAAVPTLWIVLGPLGQTVTAAHHLGVVAPGALPDAGGAFAALGLVVGVPLWGFTLLWTAIATAVTVDVARRHLPFSLTWWSFTFPLGTVVTATSGLADITGLRALTVVAVLLCAALVVAWLVVAVRTADHRLRGPGRPPRDVGRRGVGTRGVGQGSPGEEPAARG